MYIIFVYSSVRCENIAEFPRIHCLYIFCEILIQGFCNMLTKVFLLRIKFLSLLHNFKWKGESILPTPLVLWWRTWSAGRYFGAECCGVKTYFFCLGIWPWYFYNYYFTFYALQLTLFTLSSLFVEYYYNL